MNKFTETIDAYLSGSMSAEEASAFEQQLGESPELKAEYELQAQLMNGIARFGIKESVSSGFRKASFQAKLITWSIVTVIFVSVTIAAIVIVHHSSLSKNDVPHALIGTDVTSVKPNDTIPCIKPPLSGVDVPYMEYTFVAEKGDTLYYKSGTIILIPPNSVLDKQGNLVKGSVKIKYREFADPIDFFVSGIPMNYDSAGISYQFESTGMCDIQAYKDNNPVFVNPQHKPEIHLASTNPDSRSNLYYLDTVQKKWVNKGKDKVTDLSAADKSNAGPGSLLMPQKADGLRPSFSVEIEPGSMPELQAYNHLEFEIDDDGKTYDPRDSEEQWQGVSVKKGKKYGSYVVTFTNYNHTVSYLARPVFEGKNYDEAMKLFEKRNDEYKLRVAAKELREKQEKDSSDRQIAYEKKQEEIQAADKEKMKKEIENMEAENVQIAKQNRDNALENLRIAQFNTLILVRNRKIEAEISKEQEEQKKIEYEEAEKELAEQTISRTFQLERFGVWNCDNPSLVKSIQLSALFIDKKGKELKLPYTKVIFKDFNGLMNFPGNLLKVIPGTSSVILSTFEDKLCYISAQEFDKCKIDASTRQYVFTMTVCPTSISSAEEIRKVVGLSQ